VTVRDNTWHSTWHSMWQDVTHYVTVCDRTRHSTWHSIWQGTQYVTQYVTRRDTLRDTVYDRRHSTWHSIWQEETQYVRVCDRRRHSTWRYVTVCDRRRHSTWRYVTVCDRTRHIAWPRYCHLTRSPQSKCGTFWSFLKSCSWTKWRWREIFTSVWICYGCRTAGAERLKFVFLTVSEFVKLTARTKFLALTISNLEKLWGWEEIKSN